MPITLLTFSHKNDSVSAEDRAMRAHPQRQTQDRLVPLLLLSRPRKVSLDLQFHHQSFSDHQRCLLCFQPEVSGFLHTSKVSTQTV